MTSCLRALTRALEHGDLAALDDCCAPDLVVDVPAAAPDLEGLKRWIADVRTAFTPVVSRVDEFDGGDHGFVSLLVSWSHDAPFRGIAATGRRSAGILTFVMTGGNGRASLVSVDRNGFDLPVN